MMQNLFIVLVAIGSVSFLVNLIFKVMTWLKKKDKDLFDVIVASLFNKISVVTFISAIVIYGVFSFSPYVTNEKDRYLIESYNMNITLYETYIKDYQAAAQKQIEEYQSAQSTMARTATAIQLQYFSQQIDAVGKSITDKIKEFNDLIMEQRIAINDATARMTIRKLSKFYFY